MVRAINFGGKYMRVIRGWSEVNLHIKVSYLEGLSEFLDEVEALWYKKFLMLEADAEEK